MPVINAAKASAKGAAYNSPSIPHIQEKVKLRELKTISVLSLSKTLPNAVAYA
jgi:hypothetical protein